MATKIKCVIMGNPTQNQIEKAEKAFQTLANVINTQRFKDEVISFINKRKRLEFASNKGMTNLQVYELIMSGQEKLNPKKNYQWDFELGFYTKRFSRAIGYTYPNVTYIKTNTTFFNKASVPEIAGHFAHEYCHKLGFGHKSAKEHDSVPYGIGYLIRDLAKEMSFV